MDGAYRDTSKVEVRPVMMNSEGEIRKNKGMEEGDVEGEAEQKWERWMM